MTTNIAVFAGDPAYSLFFVFYLDNVQNPNLFAIGSPDTGQSVAYTPYYYNTSDPGDTNKDHLYHYNQLRLTSGTLYTGLWQFATFRYNPQPSGIDAYYYHNGALVDSDATAALAIPSNPLVSIGGFANRTGTWGNEMAGDIAEAILYSSALNTAQRILVENYLSAKYAIALTANDVYDGDTAGNGDFDLDVAGIGRESDGSNTEAHSAGMIIVNGTFLQDTGDYLLMGHKAATNGTTTADCPTGVTGRWTREWYLDKTDVVGTANGTVHITFDFSESGLGGTPSGSYTLLKRDTAGSGTFSGAATSSSISGDQITFSGVDASVLGSGFTLGSGTPTAVKLTGFEATSQADGVLVIWETANELDNVGFNLYRAETAVGPYTRLNATLIPPQEPGSVMGAVYTWLDEGVNPRVAHYYKLEDVDTHSIVTSHGPVMAAALVTPLAVRLAILRGHSLWILPALFALGAFLVWRYRKETDL